MQWEIVSSVANDEEAWQISSFQSPSPERTVEEMEPFLSVRGNTHSPIRKPSQQERNEETNSHSHKDTNMHKYTERKRKRKRKKERTRGMSSDPGEAAADEDL